MSPTNIEPVSEKFAKKLRFLLKTESVTLDSLARQVGTTRDRLQFVVDGVSKPTRHLLERLCEIFGVKPNFFGTEVQGVLEPDPPRGARATEKAPVTEPTAKKRKFDLAELAAHHQALLECLFEKRVLRPDEYEKRLSTVRSRAGLV